MLSFKSASKYSCPLHEIAIPIVILPSSLFPPHAKLQNLHRTTFAVPNPK